MEPDLGEKAPWMLSVASASLPASPAQVSCRAARGGETLLVANGLVSCKESRPPKMRVLVGSVPAFQTPG